MKMKTTYVHSNIFSKRASLRNLLKAILLLLVLVVMGSITAFGQVERSNHDFVGLTAGTDYTSISIPDYDPGTDPNRLMIVAVTTSRREVYTVTFDGEPLSFLANVDNDNSRVVFFYMVDPPSGEAVLEATLEEDDRGFGLGVATFSNVDPENPLNTFVPLADKDDEIVIEDIPTAPGSYVFSAISFEDGRDEFLGVPSNQDLLWQFRTANSSDRHWSVGTAKEITSGTTTSITYEFDDDEDFSAGAVSINAFCVLATVESSVNSCEAPIEGTITITNPVGGSGNYEYSINGGSSYQASNTFTGLAAGTYNVFIQDVTEGCERDLGFYTIPPRVNIDNVTARSFTDIDEGFPVNLGHYTGTNSNRLMLVGVSTRQREIVGLPAAGATTSQVTYAGEELTFLGSNTNREGRTFLFALPNPPSGNHTLTIAEFNDDLENNNEAVVGIITFHNVDPTNPIGDYFTNDASSNSPSLQITGTNENQLIFQVLGVHYNVTSPIPLGSGQTRQWEIQNSRPLGGGFTGNADDPNTTFNYGPMSSSRNWTLSGVAINPVPLVDLAIEKTVDDDLPFAGKTITFTLEASNIGCDDATQVLVYDLLPSGFTYVSHTASGSTTYSFETGIWNIGDLAVSATETLDIEVLVNPTGDYTNTAVITSTAVVDIDPSNNEDSVTITVCGAGGINPLFGN